MQNTVVLDGYCNLDITQDGECVLELSQDGEVGEITVVEVGEYYTGQTSVAPSTEEQTLATKGLLMPSDVTVEGVPASRITSSSHKIDKELGKIDAEIMWSEGYTDAGGWDSSIPLKMAEGKTVTPTEQTVIAINKDYYAKGAILVAPIPSNYGRVEWNGSRLTIS